jgi:CheY-like chemotaxis protein
MSPQDAEVNNWADRAAELLRLGLAELDNERYEAAAQMLLDSLTVYEANYDEEGSLSVATYLGFALYEQGQQERAVTVWEEIVRRGSSLPTVYALLAKHYKRLGQEEEVKRIFESLRRTGAQDLPHAAGDAGAEGQSGDETQPTAQPSAGDPQILVVDDEAEIRELLQRFLSELGYDVLVASDGEEALLSILHNRPALVLMDVYMPKRSGLDVLLKMRAEGIRTPVIVISGYANATFVQDGLALGAEFLPKPIDLSDLESAVEYMLGGAASGEPAEQQPSDVG